MIEKFAMSHISDYSPHIGYFKWFLDQWDFCASSSHYEKLACCHIGSLIFSSYKTSMHWVCCAWQWEFTPKYISSSCCEKCKKKNK